MLMGSWEGKEFSRMSCFNRAVLNFSVQMCFQFTTDDLSLLYVPVAAVQPVYPRVIRLMKPEQEQMAASFHHSKAAYR